MLGYAGTQSEKVLPPNVVATLDTDTDEILDYSGNPATEDSWQKKFLAKLSLIICLILRDTLKSLDPETDQNQLR